MTRETWFATSRFPLEVATADAHGPDFLVHAKVLGTTSSACGLNTATWLKHWRLFATVRHDRACLKCLDIVSGAGAG